MPIQMINDEDLLDSESVHAPMASVSQRKQQMLARQRSLLGESDTVPCQKFELVTKYAMPENEKIIYAGFLYD